MSFRVALIAGACLRLPGVTDPGYIRVPLLYCQGFYVVCWHGLGLLVLLEGSINAKQYKILLIDHLLSCDEALLC